MPGMTLVKDEPGNLRPSMALIWENITVTAAAEQKPEMTGPDIKSTRKPIEKTKHSFNYNSSKRLEKNANTYQDLKHRLWIPNILQEMKGR